MKREDSDQYESHKKKILSKCRKKRDYLGHMEGFPTASQDIHITLMN